MTFRIGIARVMQESNCLNPVVAEMEDFTTAHYLEGAELLEAAEPKGWEVPGYFRNAELSGFLNAMRPHRGEFEPVPLLSAWASSGGPLSSKCFDTLVGRLVEKIREQGPLDGVLLALHGAMGARGVRDADTQLVTAVREAAGVPVVCTHDLHGNMTSERMGAADAIVAYQTNPHRDFSRAGKKAGDILIAMLRGEMNPTMAWRTLPMILGGGKTLDFLSPVRGIFRRMRKLEKSGEVVSASTFMVHPWNDHPALGWSTIALTNGDQNAAERYAEELAEMCWAVRHDMPPDFSSAAEAVAKARKSTWARRTGVVTLSDASDVVSAGAPGDSTHLLKVLIEDGQGMLTYAAVRDPKAIDELWPGRVGDSVDLHVGGNLDPGSSPALRVKGVIGAMSKQKGFERTVTLEIDDIRLVITEGPALVMRPSFYKNVGLNPWKADVIVVKNFFPFLLFFAPMNRRTIFVRTRGTTDFDAAFKLQFDGPVHPRDSVHDWRPRDRARRGVDAP